MTPGRAGTLSRMKLLRLLLLAAALAAGAASAGTNTLCVLSWNIHIGVGMDKKPDLDRIARVIRESGADLVALQEVDRGTRRSRGEDQPAELARRLPGFTPYFAAAMPHDGGEYGECVLTRLPVVRARSAALPAGPGHEPRAAAVVEVQAGTQVVTFVATHLDHLSHDEQLAQARALEQQLALADGAPAILAGDFNSSPAQPALAHLAAGWRLAWSGEAPATWPADAPRIAIDHVLVRPAGWAEVTDCAVVPEAAASDHRPVRAQLRY